jgi:hypothetical protein
MNEPSPLHIPRPLEIDQIKCYCSATGAVEIELGGKWVDPTEALGPDQELLVVAVRGRRHRFPARQDDGIESGTGRERPDPGRWRARFTVPAWAVPHEHGQAALWLGEAVVPVPPLEPAEVRVPDAPEDGPGLPASGPEVAAGVSATRRTAPPAEISLEETVAALAVELEQSTVDAAQIRAGLAAAQSELAAQAGGQRELEATVGELRVELDRLRAQVADQRHELRERAEESEALRRELAAASASPEPAGSEAAGSEVIGSEVTVSEVTGSEAAERRSERGRGSELVVTREQVQLESGRLGEASRLLADAKALAEGLRSEETRN